MNDLEAQACAEFEARGASIAEAMCATSNEEVGKDRASPSGPGDFGLRLRLSSLTYRRGYARSSFLVSLQSCLAKSFILFLGNALGLAQQLQIKFFLRPNHAVNVELRSDGLFRPLPQSPAQIGIFKDINDPVGETFIISGRNGKTILSILNQI